MAIKSVEADPTDEQSNMAVATSGDDVTKTCMIQYDNTKTKQAIMDSLEKCKITIVEELSTLTD